MELAIVALLGLVLVAGAVVLVLNLTRRSRASQVTVPPSGKSNTLAIVAFILSFFASIPGIVCGHIALVQIGRTGDSGRGFAVAALWIGYIALAISIAVVITSAVLTLPH